MPKHEEGAARELAPEEDTPSAPRSGVVAVSDRSRSRPRGRTINPADVSARELAVGRALYPPEEHDGSARPRTRAECIDGPRPCPFVSCRHHLYLDVTSCGSMKLNFPDLEPDELVASCSLDLAAGDDLTLEEVGEAMNLTRERVRQLEGQALAKLAALRETRELRGLPEPRPRRRLPLI